MRRFVRPEMLGSLALLLALGACGKGAPEANQALASLDTRLTNAADEAGGAATETAPKATSTATTLGELAKTQAHRRDAGPATRHLAEAAGQPVGGCAGRGMRYGEQWVRAMPEGLALYPGARLIEAAGTDTGRCALRAMSFTTSDSPDGVVSYYATKVRAAGFDAERQPCATEIRLGGTRSGDDAAYMLFARRRNGVTEVDIVASAGTRT